MFQSLANYLLGSVIGQDQGATAAGVENSSIRLTSVDHDDWVLVDRDSEGNSDASSVGSMDEEDCDDMDNAPPQVMLTRSSSTSSLPCVSNMEESWFITPPPCFTSTGPIIMRTSPLENLLIEHPSMSVYLCNSNRRHLNTTTAPMRASSPTLTSDHEEEESEVGEGELDQQQQVAVAQHRQPRLNRVQVLQQQERQRLKCRRAQKVQVQRACQAIKRGYLDRSNKAREVNSRNRRQRRGERSQGANRSYANNNRKC
ncbi:hypothetical protein NQ318_010828 [Aromia moschata]|uniref:Tumor protein p53-inducible nuclear protein 1 n=1 Tax=Aromia moschata TaxID=1265417 RepID=A0AAV8YHP3_9CUCU|nr:hypothetical protein NQ318_010828 [Aromia moschata]